MSSSGAWFFVPRSQITQANFDRIQEGMTLHAALTQPCGLCSNRRVATTDARQIYTGRKEADVGRATVWLAKLAADGAYGSFESRTANRSKQEATPLGRPGLRD